MLLENKDQKKKESQAFRSMLVMVPSKAVCATPF